jgi:hypothetical protein
MEIIEPKKEMAQKVNGEHYLQVSSIQFLSCHMFVETKRPWYLLRCCACFRLEGVRCYGNLTPGGYCTGADFNPGICRIKGSCITL